MFLRSDEENNPGFTVDLLLDGSASRPALSGDYRRARAIFWPEVWLPAAFRSASAASAVCAAIRSLRILEGFQREKRGTENFRLLCRRLEPGRTGAADGSESCWIPPRRIRHLLILLTDASPGRQPQDSPHRQGAAQPQTTTVEAGVQDTAEEVRALRQKGVRVAAVFMGENASVPDARDDLRAGSGSASSRMDQLCHRCGTARFKTEIRELSS
ncbi:MAG: hypothetical protein ACLU38_08505 [Dysosmobacter sp.]